jgi:hypothetical protein
MAIIKSYTDLKQSKKLAEFLPLESADMEYLAIKENGELVGSVPFVKDDSEVEDSAYSHTYDRIACWSLAALLRIIGHYTLQTVSKDKKVFIVSEENYPICSEDYSEAVDACVDIIEKLNELNLL